MASAKNNQLISSQGPHFIPRSTAKTNDKSTNIRMASIGISDVVTASVYSEKTRMKKLMMMKMIITRKMVPIKGRARSFLLFSEFSKINKAEGETELKKNRPINLPKVITFSTDYKYTT